MTSLALGSWEMPQEYVLLRETVRRFMEHEVKPLEDQLPHDAYELEEDVLQRLQAKAREAGLWCFETPEEYGGAGLNLLGQCVAAEEAAKCRMGAYIAGCGAFGFDPPNVIWKGTAAQRDKYGVTAVATGQKTFVAISEASGGSDPARAITARAVRRGGRYILNGTKIWISGAGQANWGIVFARTGEQGNRKSITSFIVNKSKPGISVRPIPVIRSYSPYEVHFDNYEVPEEDRLGEEGEGFSLAEDWLIHARVPYAAATLGIAEAALQLAKDWICQRKAFGTLLSEKQAMQWMVADSEVELRAAKLLVYEAAWKADRGESIKLEASIAKVYGTETAGRIVDRCVQMLGGLGVAQEMPLERWYREMRIKRIGEGPSEVHRMVIARELLNVRGSGAR